MSTRRHLDGYRTRLLAGLQRRHDEPAVVTVTTAATAWRVTITTARDRLKSLTAYGYAERLGNPEEYLPGQPHEWVIREPSEEGEGDGLRA